MPSLALEQEQLERLPTVVHADADTAAAALAAEIAGMIRRHDAIGRPTVLGLATGSTPVRLYRQLIRLHREEGLSFRRVITFNLDEYYGLPRTHPESYWRFMHEQLFNHIDLPAANIHLPDGTVSRAEVFASCQAYEEKIRAAGGIDLQVLGIGRTGHIGFNEPGSSRTSRTRLVTLDALTRLDAARDFLGEANVPRHAITTGIATILEARRIVLLAWGQAKARVIAGAVEGTSDEALPASLLQGHPAVGFHLDPAAAHALTRVARPWLVGLVEWSPAMTRRAIVWLSLHLKKPVLKLLDEDYSEHGMADLLTEQGPAYGLNIRIFNQLQRTITGWPGGKPDADDAHRPERARPARKRVLILSPEPSDDILGLGGTLRRLIDQNHSVTIAYQTSGNLGVPDEEAAAAADLVVELDQTLASGVLSPSAQLAAEVLHQLRLKKDFEADSAKLRRLKSVLRRGEARAALRSSGVNPQRARFLDLPFYEQGRYRQFRIGEEDIAATVRLLHEFAPHQIFCTGHEGDPSSVAATCFAILREALARTRSEAWQADCRIWLYRHPSTPWEPAEIEMAVPLSPVELHQKVQAAYHHKSQRSQTPATGAGAHESWREAETDNRALARRYDVLGLAEYEAIEAFARYLLR